jgi:hypothetical protein
MVPADTAGNSPFGGMEVSSAARSKTPDFSEVFLQWSRSGSNRRPPECHERSQRRKTSQQLTQLDSTAFSISVNHGGFHGFCCKLLQFADGPVGNW